MTSENGNALVSLTATGERLNVQTKRRFRLISIWRFYIDRVAPTFYINLMITTAVATGGWKYGIYFNMPSSKGIADEVRNNNNTFL